jgi:hypothetical protein
MTPASKDPRVPPGMVDVADTLVDDVDALGFLTFDLDGNVVSDTRQPASSEPTREQK